MKKILTPLTRRILLAGALLLPMIPTALQAAPYASSVSYSAATNYVSFYLNENGGTVVVTYEDGSTNANYDGFTAGTNLLSGQYSFSLSGHTTYSIAVSKVGPGVGGLAPSVMQNTNSSVYSTNHVLFGCGDGRGVAVNANPTSPYFGRVYVSRGGTASSQTVLYDINPDGSLSTAGAAGSTAGISWSTEAHVVSPDRISVAPNDLLVVADWSIANAGVWLIDPNLVTNQLLLGPVGTTANPSVHSGEEGRPVLLGNLATGATLLTIDSDTPSTAPGSILAYSNITSSALSSGNGWQNVPDFVGPQVTLNYNQNIGQGFYFCPSLSVDPVSGNIFSGEFRSGVSAGDLAAVQVYDPTLHTQLWNSRYNGGNSDYFFTASSGTIGAGSPCNPSDTAVSPDGKYLAAANVDGHVTICALTNGIPNVATIYTIEPDRFTAIGSYAEGNEVAWDLADNLYILSVNNYGLKAFTLGLNTTATTIGTASGTTSFNLALLNTFVSVYATNPSPAVISQNNTYGNPTNGYFTLVRSGPSLSGSLTVNLTYSGTATNGTYTTGSAGTVVFAPNQTTTNILITAVTDGKPRLTTYLTLTAAPSSAYSLVGGGSATMSILNTATPYLIASVGAASMYNAYSNDYASVILTRWGDTNTTETVSGFTNAGTAVYGTDYTAPTSVTFTPGALTETAYVYPLIAGVAPVHNPHLAYTGNKSIILGIGSGSGYTTAPNTATMTIIDSGLPPETVLYSDPLDSTTSTADAANSVITGANDDMGNENPDVAVTFGQDLTATTYPIPFPPSGSQSALQMTVNKSQGTGGGTQDPATAVNVYLTNHVFAGNYAVRFNMNVIEPGNLGPQESGSYNFEEGPLMGINCDGAQTNWWLGSPIQAGSAPTNWAMDGIFYWISDTGGRFDDISGYGIYPYMEFEGNGSPATNTGSFTVATNVPGNFTAAFKTNVFTCFPSADLPSSTSGWTEGGPGLPVNGSGYYGLSDTSWSDVEIKQFNNVVTLSINKNAIFTYNNTGPLAFQSGQLMLGYEDPWDGGESPETAVYYSNLRVVELSPFVSGNPANVIVLQGASPSFTASATFATAPITNTWYMANGSSVPVGAAIQSSSVNATNLTSTLTLANVQFGTNYVAVFSDASGSITGAVASLEVILGPTNQTASLGSNPKFAVTASGPSAPTVYQWYTNGVRLANSTHFAGVTTATLIITNAQAADAAVNYTVAVTNAAGGVLTPAATLTLSSPPSGAVVSPATPQTNLWGSSIQFTVTPSAGTAPFTYQWKQGGVNLANSGTVSGSASNVLTLSSLTTSAAGSYTAGVTNGAGGTLSSAGTLVVSVPKPAFVGGVTIVGTNLTLALTSSNPYDTTNAFLLLNSTNVVGPYTTNTAATITGSAGSFQFQVPYTTNSAMFYKLQHAN